MREFPSHDELPLIDFCFRARTDYANGYRKMLEGTLTGRRVGKRWYVKLDAAEQRLIAEHGEPAAATA